MIFYCVYTFILSTNCGLSIKLMRESHFYKVCINCWRTTKQRKWSFWTLFFVLSSGVSVNTEMNTIFNSFSTEPRLALIWGLLISCGHRLMECNSNAREPLITLARHLQASSNSSDGWGEGLLGAIGLKKDDVTNKYGYLFIFFLNK